MRVREREREREGERERERERERKIHTYILRVRRKLSHFEQIRIKIR